MHCYIENVTRRPPLVMWQPIWLVSEEEMHLLRYAIDTYQGWRGWERAPQVLLDCMKMHGAYEMESQKMSKTVFSHPCETGEVVTQVSTIRVKVSRKSYGLFRNIIRVQIGWISMIINLTDLRKEDTMRMLEPKLSKFGTKHFCFGSFCYAFHRRITQFLMCAHNGIYA
ncbi:alpha tocopherol transfer protein [Echinococcus multilocularis]|uniref:Alpha tocopherol transfer protein n=1 Tax=Echinococcus multilocularis TaxID=6211 RepID=A0A0S4MJ26_ECHMU|nr:alpha tocopherol transfer protein [Echinococcus multilocularis]